MWTAPWAAPGRHSRAANGAALETWVAPEARRPLADAFEANLETLYRLETLNNGRPLNETRAQLRRLPDFFRYFAGLALARRDDVIPVEGNYLQLHAAHADRRRRRIARPSITR